MRQLYSKEVKNSSSSDKGDRLPLSVVMTDGSPSDTALFETLCGELTKNKYSFAMTIGCVAGPRAKVEPYTGGGHVRGRESGYVLRPPMAPVWILLKFNFFNFSQILSYISV
jgi:hypothetical protein